MDRHRTIQFESRSNTLLRQIAALECMDTTVRDKDDKVLTIARIRGVIELLTRLAVIGRMTRQPSVRATQSYLAAGIQGRRAVSERTIRRWATDAALLGLVEAIVMSHECGGRTPNIWVCHWARIDELTAACRPVPDRAGQEHGSISNPDQDSGGWTRVDTTSTPRVDTMSAPKYARQSYHRPPTPQTDSAAAAEDSSDGETIRKMLEDADVQRLQTAVGHVRRRGLSTEQLATAIAVARGNASKFAKEWQCGLMDWLRTGDWPVQVRTLHELKADRAARIQRRRQPDPPANQEAAAETWQASAESVDTARRRYATLFAAIDGGVESDV